MASQFKGQAVLFLNGQLITHVRRIEDEVSTGRQQIKGMSPDGNPIGWVDGTKSVTLNLDLFIPRSGEIDWANITDAVIYSVPRDGGTGARLFEGVVVENVGVTFEEEGAAMRRVRCFAKRVVVT